MRAVDVRLVHRTVKTAQHILPALAWSAHLLQQASAHDSGTSNQPRRSREVTLAFVLFVFCFAVVQDNVILFGLIPDVHVMLLQFYDFLYVSVQILS